MGITYLQDAMDGGLALYSDCRAVELEHAGGRVTAVRAQILDRVTARPAGPVVTVRARVTVVCGGAINTPLLLLRSGITGNDRVGLRTMFHPVVGMAGFYADRVDPWYGAPQSISSHEFVDRGDQVGFFLEAAPLQPMLASSALLSIGGDQIEFMKNLSHVSTLLSLSVDGLHPESQGGTVSLRSDGRPLIEYPVGPALQEAFLASHRAMAQVHLAAGALKTGTLHVDPVWLTDASQLDLLDAAPYGALEHSIFTAHQMGGCAMGADPETSVVDTEHRVRGFDNLFVVDGSVLPTALGVNPSETIYGLAHRARQFVGAAAGGRMPEPAAPEPAAPEPAAPEPSVIHKWPVPVESGE
jgi:choline dehydrogenase-like flavoprotein